MWVGEAGAEHMNKQVQPDYVETAEDRKNSTQPAKGQQGQALQGGKLRKGQQSIYLNLNTGRSINGFQNSYF